MPEVTIELRVCYALDNNTPHWGFVSGNLFYPFGPSEADKELAIDSARKFIKGDRQWKGFALSICGPNLDQPN